MKASHLRIAAACLIITGIFLLWLGTRKTVTLVINGENNRIATHRLRVADLLASINVFPDVDDRLSLALSTWLSDEDVIRLDEASSVIIYADKFLNYVNSPERIPANLLADAQVRLFPGDQVWVNGELADPTAPLAFNDVYRIQVKRGIELQVTRGAETIKVFTTAPTIAQALADHKLTMFAGDWITQSYDAVLFGDQKLDYRATQKLEVQMKSGTQLFYSAAPSIGAALAEQGVALQSLDYTQPGMAESLPEDGKIRLVRVSEQVFIEQEPLAFETVLEPAPDVELDQRVTLQPGRYGLLARRVRVRSEDGVEVSQKAEAEWIAQPVENKIVGYGTKVAIKTLSTPDGPIEYWRSVSMYATSYSPCRIFKDRCDSYTASGAELKKGIVAMRGYWYRYYGGTQVYVPGYGVGTVADVGGGIPGQFWIDLGYSDSDYVSWHQMVTVYFLTPVPDQIPYIVQ